MILTTLTWNLQRFFQPVGSRVARSLGAAPEAWTREAYERKLGNVAACLRRMVHDEPALVAFTEVESQEILDDLVEACGWTHLRSVDAVAPNTDLDGLDVALLYHDGVFEQRPSTVRSISLDNRLSTRDLLHARLELRGGPGAVDVAVVHWPSRLISEGQVLRMAQGFYLRRLVEATVRFSRVEIVDRSGSVRLPDAELLLDRWRTPFLAMGDFNDEPFDDSIRAAVDAGRFVDRAAARGRLTAGRLADPDRYLSSRIGLFNPCWDLHFTDDNRAAGTFYRESEWRVYDQMIMSHGALLPEARFRMLPQTARVARLRPFTDGGVEVRMANRSGLPNKFEQSDLTGVSDHFPLLVDVETA